VAIEEMAGVDILCSDKTGTITKNKLSIVQVEALYPYTEAEVILYATLTSREEDNDPFDPVAKRAEADVLDQTTGNIFKVSKGDPQVILSLSYNKQEIATKIKAIVDTLANKGYRSLGVARTNTKGNWEIRGIISLSDPPREDSREMIKTTQSMGVDVKMITGDHIAIAKEICKEIGLGRKKVKKTDIGIAVEGATDAAKSAIGIVLTQPGLSVIVDAIKESRKIFQRMNNYAIYRIGETIRILLFLHNCL
jgi:H+-transporting ATPase